jgi:hypothetical protein
MSLLSNIREQMEIITIDGACLGRVKFLSEPDQIGVSGHQGLVPVRWVAWVDGSVYLSRTRQQVTAIWNSIEAEIQRFDPLETPERRDGHGLELDGAWPVSSRDLKASRPIT